jgi:site-specific recombinase XerD
MTLTYPIVKNRSSLISSFKSWLKARNYTTLAIVNHISDINNFFDYVHDQSPDTSPYLPNIIANYIRSIQPDSNYRIQLSHLSKFFQFSLDQKLVTTNPFKEIFQPFDPPLDKILSEYSSYLSKKNYSHATIRNYLNDIRQFIDWSKS